MDNAGSAASVNVTSGNHLISAPLHFTSSGLTFNIATGHSLTLSDGLNGTGPLSIQGRGKLIVLLPSPSATLSAGPLTLASGATLDLTSNTPDSAFHSSAPPLTLLLSYIAAAYDHGAWDLPGITSSSAADNPNHATALGCSQNGDEVIIKYTWIGDANLDGVVNSADLSAMAASGTMWSQGDFNYDGKVNADDYALFMLGAAESNGENISMTLPEPTLVLSLAGLAAMYHRRHRARR